MVRVFITVAGDSGSSLPLRSGMTVKRELLDRKIHLRYDDDYEATFDFLSFVGEDALSSPLADEHYFCQVRRYENGRGLYWKLFNA